MSEYISRQKTIDFIKSEQCKQCSDIGLCGKCAVLVAIDLIKIAPTADVAPVVHGHWIEPTGAQINQGIAGSCEAICSVCGFVYADICMKYCPECGAKMDEEV